MNLNDEEEDLFFNQRCLELAKLLRTEQTEDFLHLYDSLPSEWNGSREYLQLEAAKEYIRQLQEFDEKEFQRLYQRAFENEQIHPTIIMSNLPLQSTVIRHHDNDSEQIITTNSRITSPSLLQQKQHNERITANNLACDEKHDLTSKHSSSIKKNNEEFNTKTRRLQPITNNNTHDIVQNNCRTHTPVDSFVQLNLKSPINIRLEDYKKAIDPMSVTQKNGTTNRPFIPQSIETSESHQQNTTQSDTIKKSKTSTTNKSHEDASFDYFLTNDDNIRQHSRSSSSSSSNNNKTDLSINPPSSQTNSLAHSKLIPNNDFDSHGSSIATKSSSENSGSARTASGSDSDDEHHHHHHHQSGKQPLPPIIKSSLFAKTKSSNDDNTPTIVLNKTSDHRTSQHDRISSLPEQNSYELVKVNTPDEHPLLGQISRFKQPVLDDPNGIHNPTNDLLSYTPQRPQPSSSSHQNRNPERHEQYNPNHSNSSRKSSTRSTKKRKQVQQDIIRTELIPGHRGDRDVDELVMFIDGQSSSKSRQNSVPLRLTDTNSNSTSRRKSRKPIKIPQDHENKTSQIDEDIQSISFIDDDDQTTTSTTSHSLNNTTYHEQISLPNDDDESHSNTTNGEVSLPDWHNTSPANDDIDSLSLSSLTLNNSNSEIISEPFVTVTHRRRSIKERRNNNNNSSSRISHVPEKHRLQSTQNGVLRHSTIQNSLSNIKPFVSTTTKEENTNITSPPPSVSQRSALPSTSGPEQSSPRLSSHSSSSSLSSLLKRQSKAPPVVFLNKSLDIELNDVSFGFDVENPTADKAPTPTPPSPLPPPPAEPTMEKETNPSSSSRRSYPQRNPHAPLFFSGSDIRSQQHRNYPSQSQYIDPLLLLQYNQQRYQQLAYMNLLRTQYLSSQSPYVLIPTTTTTNQDEKDETSEQIQEPLLVYTTIPGQTGPMYYQPTKKSFESVYPSQYFYPTHPAYFQPISSSSSLLIDNKSQQDDTDNDEEEEEEEDNDFEKSTRLFQQTRQQSSSHIMSNALQLVYSQEKRNAQTDRFNLDQLTAYLAMKWTDTIDHYEQGDDEILLTGEQ